MGTPNTPGESPASGSKDAGPDGNKARSTGPNPTAGEVAGRSADAARAEQARTMRDRVGQQETAASEAVTKERPAAQKPRPGAPAAQTRQQQTGQGQAGPAPAARPPASRPARPVITGTAAPRGQQGGQTQDAANPEAPTVEASASPQATASQTAGAVDAPTSHISRNKVSTTGMTDLSAIPHPSTAPADSSSGISEGRPRPAVSVGSRRGRGPLRASMQLRSIDPWSALKISLLLSIGLFFVWLVAVGIIYLVLDGMGVWDRLNTGVTDLMENTGGASPLIGPGQVFGVAAIIGIINVVLFTAMATIGAFVYNMSADAVGGVEVTLADRD